MSGMSGFQGVGVAGKFLGAMALIAAILAIPVFANCQPERFWER